MSFQPPPMELDKWTPEILNELVKYPDIEGEKFDFKDRKMGDIAQDICAMANTLGGILVIGISQREESGALQFYKDGWDLGKENAVNNQIGNHIANIDPSPNVKYRPLYDSDKFYMLAKIEPVIRDRPYIIKGSGACYMRIGDGSHPASRDFIINLCKLTIDRTTSVANLDTFTSILRELILHIDNKATEISQTYSADAYFVPEIDTEGYKHVAATAMWFLLEHDLVEAKWITGPGRKHGLYTVLNTLQELNGAIKRFNMDHDSFRGQDFSKYYSYWKTIQYQWLMQYLEEVSKRAREYLASK